MAQTGSAPAQPSAAELLAKIAQLEGLLAQASEHKREPNALSYKVSAKGAVSVYGLGKFPVTLYAGQFRRLFAVKDAIEAFMAANKDKLAEKEKAAE